MKIFLTKKGDNLIEYTLITIFVSLIIGYALMNTRLNIKGFFKNSFSNETVQFQETN